MKQITFPVLQVKMVPVAMVVANDYNPNKVALPEYNLLIHSIEEDGMTQPIVTFYDPNEDHYVVVDGFHRYKALREHFKCPEIPIVVIEKDIKDRMASTIRHNRARGKHQVDLQADLVKKLQEYGWDAETIAKHLGMSGEEVLRLMQQVGVASMLRNDHYDRAWEPSKE